MLGMHVRRKFGDQVRASAPANSTDAEAGPFGRGSGRLADGGYLQRNKGFPQVEAKRGGAVHYCVDGILAAKNDPFELFLLQFAQRIVELVKVQRRFDTNDRKLDWIGTMRAQRVGNRVR